MGNKCNNKNEKKYCTTCFGTFKSILRNSFLYAGLAISACEIAGHFCSVAGEEIFDLLFSIGFYV